MEGQVRQSIAASLPLTALTLPQRAEELARAYGAAMDITSAVSSDYQHAHDAAMEAMRLALAIEPPGDE